MRATSDADRDWSSSVQVASKSTVSLDMPLVDGTAKLVMLASGATLACNHCSSRTRTSSNSRLDFCALAMSTGSSSGTSAPRVPGRALFAPRRSHLGEVVALVDERLVDQLVGHR